MSKKANTQGTVELLVLPYASIGGKSLLGRLIEELNTDRWTRFRAAVAFGRVTGNVEELLDALENFARRGNYVQLTFGADLFGTEAAGSDLEAIETLIKRFKGSDKAYVYIYHEKNRTFHPKVYLFDDQEGERALLVIGSSNWSRGGLSDNIEANVVLHLDLGVPEHKRAYEEITVCFNEYWSEP